MRALVIRADDTHEVILLDTETPGALQKIVGGYIEAYTIPGHDARMYMNEDGRMLNLGPNFKASRLLRTDVVGDVVVLGTGAEPEDAPVPQSVLDTLPEL